MSKLRLILGSADALDPTLLESAARAPRLQLRLSAVAWSRVRASEKRFRAAVERGAAVYGTTTGFGPLVGYAADRDTPAHARGLLAHLGTAWGPPAPREVVRGAMVLRAQALALGFSGVRPDVLRAWLAYAANARLPCHWRV